MRFGSTQHSTTSCIPGRESKRWGVFFTPILVRWAMVPTSDSGLILDVRIDLFCYLFPRLTEAGKDDQALEEGHLETKI